MFRDPLFQGCALGAVVGGILLAFSHQNAPKVDVQPRVETIDVYNGCRVVRYNVYGSADTAYFLDCQK